MKLLQMQRVFIYFIMPGTVVASHESDIRNLVSAGFEWDDRWVPSIRKYIIAQKSEDSEDTSRARNEPIHDSSVIFPSNMCSACSAARQTVHSTTYVYVTMHYLNGPPVHRVIVYNKCSIQSSIHLINDTNENGERLHPMYPTSYHSCG